MSIAATSDFAMVRSERFENKSPKIALRHSRTNKVIKAMGAILEAQFKTGDDYLLFITEDCPFEEALHILLVSSEMKIKEAIELAAPYTPGLLRNVAIVEPNIIEFDFFNAEEKWMLEVLESSRIELWGNRFPMKRKSPFLHRTWLVLKGPVWF